LFGFLSSGLDVFEVLDTIEHLQRLTERLTVFRM